MSRRRTCPACGAQLLDGVEPCTRCLLELGLATEPGRSAEPGGNCALRFGDYEIAPDSSRLEGGMGVVYRARQLSLRRTVALKMIRGGVLLRPEQAARFRAEAEAAASLDHPNIVPIYEIGEYDGRQFFTMKWLEGGSLADTVRARRNQHQPASADSQQPKSKRRKELAQSGHTPREAAALVSTVARAIHHAHQRGIIHRDLKPSNILMDARRQPHVSDFGLAKRSDGDAALTLSGETLGTPSYMSPEQAAGDAREVTTAADIYSLGAILYELLTGEPPFVARIPAAIMQKVLTEEPKRPSTIVTGFPRDLETICLKCLEKEPRRRYGSAEALADDLDRWLRGEPILAQPSGIWARTHKWARRKPAIAILTAAILLTALLGFGGVLWQFGRTRSELQKSELLTEALKDFLPSLRPGLADTERDSILQEVATRLQTKLGDNPAMLNYLLGLIDYSRGQYAQAEAEFRTALDLYENGRRMQPADVAECLNSLAIMIQKQDNNRRAEAEPLYRRALEILTKLYGPADPKLDEPRRNLAFVLRRLWKFPESEALYRQAWTIEQQRHGPHSEQAAVALVPLIQVMLQQRKSAEGEPLAREALAILEDLNPADWHYSDAQSLLGGCLLGQKRFTEAEPLLLSGCTGLLERASPNSALGHRQTADAMLRLVQYFEDVGLTDESAQWKRKLEEFAKNFSAMMDAKAANKDKPKPD